MSVYCTLFSQTFYGLLFLLSYHYRCTCNVVFTNYRFPVSSCCTSQPPKKLNQIITVNSSMNTPRSYHQKNNSCTLCVPMFFICFGSFSLFIEWYYFKRLSSSTLCSLYIILRCDSDFWTVFCESLFSAWFCCYRMGKVWGSIFWFKAKLKQKQLIFK